MSVRGTVGSCIGRWSQKGAAPDNQEDENRKGRVEISKTVIGVAAKLRPGARIGQWQQDAGVVADEFSAGVRIVIEGNPTQATRDAAQATAELMSRYSPALPQFQRPVTLRVDPSVLTGGSATPDGVLIGLADGKNAANFIDVQKHELGHAFAYRLQQPFGGPSEEGAIHESLGDVFAAATKDDWVIRDFVPRRNMAHPERSPWNPAWGKQGVIPTRFEQADFYSGVFGHQHMNAGIGNRAAYLTGEKLGRLDMSDIYMLALADNPHANGYARLAGATVDASARLDVAAPRAGQPRAEIVRAAWNDVGVMPDPLAGTGEFPRTDLLYHLTGNRAVVESPERQRALDELAARVQSRRRRQAD